MCFGPKGRKRRGGGPATKPPGYIRGCAAEGRGCHPGLLDEGAELLDLEARIAALEGTAK